MEWAKNPQENQMQGVLSSVMKWKKWILLAALGGLVSCASVKKPEAAAPAAPVKKWDGKSAVSVKMELLNAKGGVVQAPTVVTRRGQRAKIEMMREVLYPTGFNRPDPAGWVTPKPGDGNSFPVTPTTPTGFTKVDAGWTFEFTPHAGRDGEIYLKGVATQVKTALHRMGYGEWTDPIMSPDGKVMLTENKALGPVIRRTETPFHLWAMPGKAYDIEIGGEVLQAGAAFEPLAGTKEGTLRMRLTCEMVATGAGKR